MSEQHRESAGSPFRAVGTAVVLFGLLASGCTVNGPYRDASIEVDPQLALKCVTIELDDQGELWDEKQLAAGVRAIRETTPGHPINLVVFVHGWKHNGSDDDENVVAFKRVLVNRAREEAVVAGEIGRDPEAIVGVFLGWRGLSLKPALLREFSFWSRRGATPSRAPSGNASIQRTVPRGTSSSGTRSAGSSSRRRWPRRSSG